MSQFFRRIRISGLLRVAHAIDRFTERMGGVMNWLVVITVIVGFYNVAARYLGRFVGLKLASNALLELQWYLFSVLFCLGFAYILKHGSNVRVDFLYAQFSEKRKAWIDLLGTLLLLIPFCILGIYVAINPVLISWGHLPDGTWGTWEVSSDADGLPRAPIKTMIIVAFGLLLLQAVSQAIKYFGIVLGYQAIAREVREETAEHLPYE